MTSSLQLSRRGFLGVGGVALGAVLLSSCAPTVKPAPGANGPTEMFWSGKPMVLGDDPFAVRQAKKLYDLELRTVSVSAQDYMTRLQALLVGGDIPDLMWIADPNQVQQFAKQGVVAEVTRELIADRAPTLNADIDDKWSQGWAYQFVDGKNYGIPTPNPIGRFSSGSMWRTDLLQQVGIDTPPDTLDDAEDAFAELKKAGILGMTTEGSTYNLAFHTIFGAYGAMPTAWQKIDGNIINGAVSDQAREALERLNGWYRAGYIDTEFATTEAGAQKGKLLSGAAAFYDYAAFNALREADPSSFLNVARSTNPNATMEFVRSFEGPGGRGAWAWGTAGNTYAFSPEFAKDSGKLGAALDILEDVYADEAKSTLFTLGEEGTHYELTDASAGLAGGFSYIGDFNDVANRDAEGLNSFFGIPRWDVADYSRFPDPTVLEGQGDLRGDGIVDYFGKASVVPGSSTYWANLINLKLTAYTEFVNGTRSISDWDTFVDEWNANGGSELQVGAEKLVDELG
jgi:putative aldouronate transport system substrate-binding protein